MKKLSLFLVFLTVVLFFTFSDNGEQEEIDFLLFLPNSGFEFADAAQAGTQLDNMARYLRSRNLIADQIYVYGYAADVANDIDPETLSGERALHVIGELQRRGIAREFFTAPVGYGSVNLWGNNINEDTRSPNRRVRVLFEDKIITPEIVQEAEPEILLFEAEVLEHGFFEEPAVSEAEPKKPGFPWWVFLIPLLPFLIYLFSRKSNSAHKTKSAEPKPTEPKPESAPVPIVAATPKAEPAPVPVAAAPKSESATAPVEPKTEPVAAASSPLIRPEGGEPKYKRLTEEEIRTLAYQLFEERCHEHGYHNQDWLNAISQLTAMYEAQGYIVIWP